MHECGTTFAWPIAQNRMSDDLELKPFHLDHSQANQSEAVSQSGNSFDRTWAMSAFKRSTLTMK
jgi:hypothetical protein